MFYTWMWAVILVGKYKKAMESLLRVNLDNSVDEIFLFGIVNILLKYKFVYYQICLWG